jgi:DNA adenine methylase
MASRRADGSMVLASQLGLFGEHVTVPPNPPRFQLLKWIGNKQRFAMDIVARFPGRFVRYYEPFLGSGAVLATLAPPDAFASDSFGPLIEVWQALRDSPSTLVRWYEERCHRMAGGDKAAIYEEIKRSYNRKPNGADLVFLSRACYGGVVRFRQSDGYMSTPCGVHSPISPGAFSVRVAEWHARVQGSTFARMEFEEAMSMANQGDLVYCDPPYSDSQSILYGAQSFSIERLMQTIEQCKARGVFVALSIDGTKRSGSHTVQLPIPRGLFVKEVLIDVGRSMLKRFQMNGRSLENEIVQDRLLLTY